jgi:hypothetical protein
LPDFLNEKLTDDYDRCFVHLFYNSSNSGYISFLSSFKCNWNNLYTVISYELSAKNLPLFQIRVGIVETPDLMPTLENGQTYFTSAQSFLNGRRIMTIIVSSQSECKFFIIILLLNF